MKADIELKLIHDGDNWVAKNGELEAKAETLGELDLNVKRALLEEGKYAKGACITVFMGFDFETIPMWLRQYHTHYFNRSVELEL